MIRSYTRLVAIVVLGLISVLSIARIARAGGQPTAQELANQCGATIMELYADHQDRIDLQYDDAVAELQAAAVALATPAQLFKLASNHATRIEKDAYKTASQMERIINKCLAKLDRLEADPAIIEDVEDLMEGVQSTRSDSTEAVDGLAGAVGALLAG